jgi:hypothetical protein
MLYSLSLDTLYTGTGFGLRDFKRAVFLLAANVLMNHAKMSVPWELRSRVRLTRRFPQGHLQPRHLHQIQKPARQLPNSLRLPQLNRSPGD